MDKGYFINTGVSSWAELNCEADQSFFDSSQDKFSYLDSSLLPNEALAFRELIGKLSGGMGTPTSFSAAETSNFASTTTDCSSMASPKLNLPILDPMSFPNLGSSETLAPPLPLMASDPAFVERAAKFSCFGSRSFSGRSPPRLGLSSNGELGARSSCNPFSEGNCKLSRVSSSPALKQGGSASRNSGQMEIPKPGNVGFEKKLSKLSGSNANSSNEGSISEQIPSGETGSKISNGMSHRKRKSVKTKEDGSNSAKVAEGSENEKAKRAKAAEGGKIEAKTEEETKGGSNDENEKQKASQKPPEPPKDYIHVRARRGQATDSHSLAERVRREKISERMKLLQDLVPGCNKVTGKALMLDEIINYVQSLQRQVEFLSMKLASVNPGLDFNIENLASKDIFQQNASTIPPRQMYPLDSSSSAFYQQSVHQNHNNGTNISITPLSQCPVDSLPMDARNLGIHLPSVDGFNQTLPQFPSFSEDDLQSIVHDLQSIVQMGLVNFPVSNPTPDMKDER